MFHNRNFQIGDRVVFRLAKRSTHPGPRARDVWPEPCGDGYHYHVDKLWTVQDVRDTHLVVLTRRGKRRLVDVNDPRLRTARWWERVMYADRFPDPQSTPMLPA